MRNLEDVFKEALDDDYAGILDDHYVESRIVFGIKISRDRECGDIEILNTSKGGDYYEEISNDEYEVFLGKGWRRGVYVVSLSNYRRKLDAIEFKINNAIQRSATKKEIDSWQDRRKTVMKQYTKITNKLKHDE